MQWLLALIRMGLSEELFPVVWQNFIDLGGDTINETSISVLSICFPLLHETQTPLPNDDGIASDYGLHSLSQIPKETYISLLRGKNRENNVLAVTNEKLHAWSASCGQWPEPEEQESKQWFLITFSTKSDSSHIEGANIQRNACKLVQQSTVWWKTLVSSISTAQTQRDWTLTLTSWLSKPMGFC